MDKLTHTFGHKTVTETEREKNIRQVFKLVASRYDLMNDFMSFGVHRIWKRMFVNQINFKSTDIIVDLAGGTGDIARKLSSKLSSQLSKKGGSIIIVDPGVEMMLVGRDNNKPSDDNSAIQYLAATGESLPFADNSIDIITISFGIRNMTRMSDALKEIYRVLKPGGQFQCLEFSKPNAIIRPFYSLYNTHIIPRLGAMVAGQPEAYQYLVESIQRFPDQQEMKSLIEEAGFKQVSYANLFFGIACIHQGIK
jgi:demethylmenaquinone methyltransferase/2-methoxy-6-polyprenyl-1,4-benzoquinol methylase